MKLKSVTTACLLFAFLPLNLSAFAQQPTVAPSPLIEQMLRAAPEGDTLVELRGYVGPSGADSIRLYQDLTLRRYLEFPRSAVVHSVYEGDVKTGPVKLYVKGSTTVTVASRLTASAAGSSPNLAALASQRAMASPGAGPGAGPGPRPRAVEACYEWALQCFLGHIISCALADACYLGAL